MWVLANGQTPPLMPERNLPSLENRMRVPVHYSEWPLVMQMQLIRSERDFHFVVITLFYSASLMDTEISGLLNVSQQAITKTRHSEFHFIEARKETRPGASQ